MHTLHAGLSIAAVIRADKVGVVDALLTTFNDSTGNNPKMPFARCATTHFASGVIIPAQDAYGKVLPATLMLFTSYTGPFKHHLNDLVATCGKGLKELLVNCTDFPADGILASDEALKQFIREHKQRDTFYSGMQYITHTDVGREQELRKAIEDYIDAEQSSDGFSKLTENEIRTKIQNHISGNAQYAWAAQSWKRSFPDFWALWGGGITVGAALLGVLVILSACLPLVSCCGGFISAVISFILYLIILVVLPLVFLVVCYRLNEKKQTFVAPRQPDEQVRKVLSTQNHPVINEMTLGGPLKKGWIHPLTYRLVLRLVSLVRGILNIPTIATARWLTIDNGRRLVFISNFGNLSESYVRDFIDSRKSAQRINLLFGQGNGYPPTKWIMGQGALVNPDAFLNDVHSYQQITKFWYWPYMDLSIDNINANRRIRLGLYAQLSDQQVKEWLQLF